MTVSMRVMSAGDGYKYLLRTVVAGDGDRSLSTSLTRYYAEAGTPPGRWLGSGVRSLGGMIAEGDQVSEAQLELLLGLGKHPVTGASLGLAYPAYKSVAERIEERIAALDPGLGPVGRAEAVASIETEDQARGARRAVAGYDFTFSIPKSASVLWAVADAGTQALIADAHHAAVAEVVAFMEREVAATRTGATGRDGAVAQVDVAGLIATAFDHYDSRAGDPHPHTHVVISNKVQTVLDGKWRSLDGRPMHAATVALSELHEAVFADHLTRSFGVEWEARDMGRDRNPAWAVAAVPEELVKEFSTRARHIDAETDRLIGQYVEAHGRRPSPATIMKLRAQATLSTRPEKEVRSLADLTSEWRHPPRLGVYMNATGGDAGEAFALYEWNAGLGAAFAVDINAKPRASLDRAIREAGGRKAPPGKVIAQLTFGFWRYLTSSAHEVTLWRPALHHAFPPGTSRPDVDTRVGRLHELRNRVAHHEPLLGIDAAELHGDLLHVVGLLDPQLRDYIHEHSKLSDILTSRPGFS